MNFYPLTSLLGSLHNFIIGLFVLSRDKKNRLYQTYFLLCVCTGFWALGAAGLSIAHNRLIALIIDKNLYAWGVFVPGFYAEFIYRLLGKYEERKKMIYFSRIISSILLFFVLFTDYFIKDEIFRNTFVNYMTKPGIAYHIFLVFLYVTVLSVVFELFKVYQISEGRRKLQLKYILFSTLFGFGCTTNYFLIVYAPELLNYPSLGNLSLMFYLSLMSYAILRHNLLDIEVIIKKTLVFAGLLASVFAMLILPTLIIQEYIFRGTGTGGKVIGLTISGIIIMLALRRIENFLINVTDKVLFQKKYDYKELLKTFTSEVLTVLDLNRLVRLTVSKLSDIIKLQSCGILLLDEDKGKYDLVASQGIKERNIALGAENTLITFLSRAKTYLSVKPHEKELQMPQEIIEDMNKLKFELAIPLLTLQGDMVGILTLGKKKSDEDYTQDDMDIIVPLARTLAIAINNAQMFDELGKTQAEAAQKEKMAVIGTLSAGINHEICNPLGIARGQCEAFLLNIKDGLYKNKTEGELLEKAQSIMGKVIHETDRATAITKRLSSFAKPSKGVISANINVKDEIDEVLALVGYELKLDKIDIVKDIEKNLPLLTGDKKQLQEVFFNLVRNAAQAIKEKGRITIKAREADGKISIEIEDTGHGIPENKLEQIFNPFYTTKEPGKGTGLGLFIVRQVVERNRGKISVKSKVNEGTTFMLEFPIKVKSKA